MSSDKKAKAKRQRRANKSHAEQARNRRDFNKHDLPRRRPAEVDLQVRMECFNGCVICGQFPYHYDHFDPEFVDAKVHDPKKIALLCPNHHGQKTAGLLSTDLVATRRAAPFNRDKDARYEHTFGPRPLTMVVGGGFRASGQKVMILINGVVVFGVENATDPDDYHLIDGVFVDPEGRQTLQFQRNEVIAARGCWDVNFEGTVLTVRTKPHNIVAQVQFEPDNGEVIIRRLEMRLANDNRLSIDSNRYLLHGPQRHQEFRGSAFGGDGSIGIGVPVGKKTPGTVIEIEDPLLGTLRDWLR